MQEVSEQNKTNNIIARAWLTAVHPPLVGAFSVLSLYSHNLEQVFFYEVLPLSLLVITSAFVLLFLLFKLTAQPQRAALYATALLLVTLFYGHFFAWLDELLAGRAWHKIVLPAIFLCFSLGCYWIAKSKSRLQSVSLYLSVTSVVLVAIPVFSVVADQVYERRSSSVIFGTEEINISDLSGRDNLMRPSVYYLVFDRYPSNRTLTTQYSFDNEEFLEFLRTSGFVIMPESQANYLKTFQSLAATLNMKYVNEFADTVGRDSGDYKPVYKLFEDYEVQRVFRALGYEYVHLGSTWEPTRRNKFADVNFNSEFWNEFDQLFWDYTIFPVFVNAVTRPTYLSEQDKWQAKCVRVAEKFEALSRTLRTQKPTFVFAHMLIPHGPYVFDGKGRCISMEQASRLSREENHIQQILFANLKIREFIELALKSNSNHVIILQSDEGPFPDRYLTDEIDFDWRHATELELQKKFGILNAQYIPGIERGKFKPDLSPVNTFRFIFSELFGLPIELLPDRSFAFVNQTRLYDFFEVTDKLRGETVRK